MKFTMLDVTWRSKPVSELNASAPFRVFADAPHWPSRKYGGCMLYRHTHFTAHVAGWAEDPQGFAEWERTMELLIAAREPK